MTKNILEDKPNLANQYAKKVTKRHPKNLILYGPPGTGKTYTSINQALAIIEERSLSQINQEPRQDLIQRFRNYQERGQIDAITFHQSYGYEDFIQGLKPDTRVGTLLFERRDGAFKRLADRARKNYEHFTRQQSKPKIPFEDLLNLLLTHEINPETEEIEIPLSVDHRIYKSIIIYDISAEALIYRRRTKNDIVKDEAKTLYIKKLDALYQGAAIKEAINEKYYRALVQAVQKYESNLSEEEENHELKNYVLIIDEINRANISRVFGELITLIEEDKRLGASQALQITLASGEAFSVPQNLYILGTMNTADKSIAFLDLALRRRFVFQAMYPQENLIENPQLRQTLANLNQALLQEKKSPDLLIGHGFFMQKNSEDFSTIFNQQILPLLDEYFPQRRDKVKKILQKAGIQIKEVHYQLKFDGFI